MASAPKNLTGVPIQPSIWSDLGLGDKQKEPDQLSEEEKKRRKKMLAASQDLGIDIGFPRDHGLHINPDFRIGL